MKKFDLKDDVVERTVPEKAGIYHVFCFRNENQPLKIGRLLKIDDKGILYIGSGKNLRKRLTQFLHGMTRRNSHSGGNRYGYLDLADEKKLGRYKLKFSFKVARNFEYAESEKLDDYMETFGELPPLNNREPIYDDLKKLGRAE